MNVNEMMSMIDKKVSNDKDKARQKEIETKNRFDIALAKIKELKPRIDDLIKLANYAKDNGINFDKTGMFYTNSWSHLVGFLYGNPITMLGIDAGGACGDVDFRTNGEYTSGLNRKTMSIVEPRLYHMETFIKKFDEFEREFYAYIEKVCK